jgi:xanthine/CO dehydrogenase XdhC/CoxF family maturation factor
MAERRRIIRQWRQGASSALVTLVHAQGSSYRQPGARLLIGADGEYAGSISGGCLEAEVVRKAAWIVRAGAVVERYSTLFDDTAEIPYGLGCGGVVDLLLEPVDTPECRALLEAIEASLTGVETRVATWLPESVRELRRAIFAADGSAIFASAGLSAVEIETARAASVAEELSAGILAAQRVYVERLAAPQRLFVLGAGEDAKPVVTMAALLGWRVVVADGRAQMARAERFPEAERVVAASSIAELGVRAADAVVLMTHSYEQDRTLLIGLLDGAEVPGYIGLLGASHRSSLLVAEAAAKLGIGVAECCERVWAPVGLDLGGDGPEAIALAIIAEVQAWRQGRLAAAGSGRRRLTAETVAEYLADPAMRGGALRYLQPECALGQ